MGPTPLAAVLIRTETQRGELRMEPEVDVKSDTCTSQGIPRSAANQQKLRGRHGYQFSHRASKTEPTLLTA